MKPVLIVGAGPTGLVLALWLKRRGIPLRIIDKTLAPGTTSRAFAVQARTLELYMQVPGLAEDIVREGLKAKSFNLWARGRPVVEVPIGEFGRGLSPFPFLLVYPQDAHEKTLIRYLGKEGVFVERGAELLDFKDHGAGVSAVIRGGGREETAEFSYICGCDGAHSTVRKNLGLHFPGGTYEHVFYVADVEAKGLTAGQEPYFCLEEKDFCLVFPLLHGVMNSRLVGVVPREVDKDAAEISFADVEEHVRRNTGLTVSKVNWFSTYHVHHRAAEKFRQGRAFLLGDAAHIHSPAGGQGMNTGIGDAINLAWKLAEVLQGRMRESILDTYESERMAFAHRLIKTTDRIFKIMTDPSWRGRLVRGHLFPFFLPWAIRIKLIRNFLFKTISQLVIHYQQSKLSSGKIGKISGGDRWPMVSSEAGWRLEIYGDQQLRLEEFCKEKDFSLRLSPWSEEAAAAGIVRNALYLIRPDGYVGFAGTNIDDLSGYWQSLTSS